MSQTDAGSQVPKFSTSFVPFLQRKNTHTTKQNHIKLRTAYRKVKIKGLEIRQAKTSDVPRIARMISNEPRRNARELAGQVLLSYLTIGFMFGNCFCIFLFLFVQKILHKNKNCTQNMRICVLWLNAQKKNDKTVAHCLILCTKKEPQHFFC